MSGGIRGAPAGWRPCCFTDLWDNFLTSGFQPLMVFAVQMWNSFTVNLSPLNSFFLHSRNSSKPICKLLEGPQTTGWKPQDMLRKNFQSQLHLLKWIPCTNNFESHEKLASETMVPHKRFSLCFSKSVTRIHKIFIWSQLNKWYLNVFKDLKLISPLCIQQEKKAWKCFPTNKLQIQMQVILNNVHWEWFSSFHSSTDNKATVRNLTQIEIKTTHSDWNLPERLWGSDNRVRLTAGFNSELF